MQKPETLSLVTHALDTWQAQLWRALPDMVSALIVLVIFLCVGAAAAPGGGAGVCAAVSA